MRLEPQQHAARVGRRSASPVGSAAGALVFAQERPQIYTGIGSRETPVEILQLMARIGYTLAQNGWILRSGHAPGADQAFEHGARQAKGKMEIYLPWNGFENAYTGNRQPEYIVGFHPDAERVASLHHPAWERCSQGARKLHTRNVFQVAGLDLETFSDMVICWTKDGKRGGGTGQTLRIAEHLQIPIFDLAVIANPEVILEFINYGVVP